MFSTEDIILWLAALAFCSYMLVSAKRWRQFQAEEAVSRRHLAVITAAHAYHAENAEDE